MLRLSRKVDKCEALARGGYETITEATAKRGAPGGWREVGEALGHAMHTSATAMIREHYKRFFEGFELRGDGDGNNGNCGGNGNADADADANADINADANADANANAKGNPAQPPEMLQGFKHYASDIYYSSTACGNVVFQRITASGVHLPFDDCDGTGQHSPGKQVLSLRSKIAVSRFLEYLGLEGELPEGDLSLTGKPQVAEALTGPPAPQLTKQPRTSTEPQPGQQKRQKTSNTKTRDALFYRRH